MPPALAYASAAPALAAAPAATVPSVAAAEAAERDGRPADARAIYEQVLYTREPRDSGFLDRSALLRWVARTHMTDGNTGAALDCLDAALAVAELGGDDGAAAHALNALAIIRWREGAMEEAEHLACRARERAQDAGDRRVVGLATQLLGVLATVRGAYGVARAHHTESLAQYRALGLADDVCAALVNLAMLHLYEQRWADAAAALAEADAVARRAGNTSHQAQVAANLAELHLAQRDYAPAADAAHRALAQAERVGNGYVAGQAAKALGVVARECGRADAAAAHFAHAESLARAHANLLLEAEVARERAELARRGGHNRELLQQLNRAHRLFARLRAERALADIGRRMGALEDEFVAVARRWGESIEAKDRYTQGHCQRVADLACRIAERAGGAEGFDAQAMFWFRIGALLHDVGKINVPEAVLNKPGRLTDEEFALMRRHPEAGVAMLADVEFPWDVRPVVEHHHERWDGTGYPHGLAGDAIPLTARILCVADVYDALTSVRSYKRAFGHDDAMAIMRQDVGRMFDPRVFGWFEAVAGTPAAG